MPTNYSQRQREREAEKDSQSESERKRLYAVCSASVNKEELHTREIPKDERNVFNLKTKILFLLILLFMMMT